MVAGPKREPRPAFQIAEGVQALKSQSIFDRDAFGAYPSMLCQLSLPSRKQLGLSEYTRKFNNSGVDYGFSIFTPVEYGIPFGAYARAIFSFVWTTAMKQKNQQDHDPREIYLGRNLSNCMTRITGFDHSRTSSGGSRSSRAIFETQLNSFTRSQMRFYRAGQRRRSETAFALVSQLEQESPTLFDVAAGEPEWETRIRLSEEAYLDATEHSVPIDLDILRTLWPSPLKIDIYTWLTRRGNALNGSTLVLPWMLLQQQFAHEYALESHRQFRAQFRKAVKAIQQVYDVNDRDCITFREENDKVSITVKRPSVLRLPGAGPAHFLSATGEVMQTVSSIQIQRKPAPANEAPPPPPFKLSSR